MYAAERPGSASLWIAVQVQDSLAHCKAAGRSPRTYRDAYGYPLQSVLIPFCEREGITALDQLDRRALDRLASEPHDRERPLSKASVKSYLKERQPAPLLVGEGVRDAAGPGSTAPPPQAGPRGSEPAGGSRRWPPAGSAGR